MAHVTSLSGEPMHGYFARGRTRADGSRRYDVYHYVAYATSFWVSGHPTRAAAVAEAARLQAEHERPRPYTTA